MEVLGVCIKKIKHDLSIYYFEFIWNLMQNVHYLLLNITLLTLFTQLLHPTQNVIIKLPLFLDLLYIL